MGCVGRCTIYENRPAFCRDYPKVTDFLPPDCTFHFVGAERRGSCQPEVCGQNMCCAYPREGGEPTGISLDSLAGGMPCKHLTWIESETVKRASSSVDSCVETETAEMLSDMFKDL